MPTPTAVSAPPTTLDFYDALRDVVRGCKITRREWASGDRVFLQSGILHIQIEEDRPDQGIKKGLHKLTLSEADILAEDWMVVR